MAQNRRVGFAVPRAGIGQILLFGCIYLVLGGLSFSTAYVQTNTAAVWIPSGYAVGLIIAQGFDRWPAVALGSFVLNTLVNIVSHGGLSIPLSMAVAAPIAVGNVGEAVLGGYLARRFAAGSRFLSRPWTVAAFALLVVPLAPLPSMGVGVLASRLGGLATSGSLSEIMLTWYVANAIGILVFAGPVVAILARTVPSLPMARVGQIVEALLLAACLIFASQAICGFYLYDSLRGWPKSYMISPLLLWAGFRFGTPGALLSILLVTLISVIGTMRGFQAFPADTPSRALIYLQVFLGVVAVMTLLISAGLSENWDLQANLEDKIRARTGELDRLLREKDAFTTLVAHDLQSPVYGVRNALRAAVQSIETNRVAPHELVAALGVMEKTCSTLAERVAALLAPPVAPGTETPIDLATILQKIGAVHRLNMDGKAATLRIIGDTAIGVPMPSKVEHILDILVDNAIKFSPSGSPIEVTVTIRADVIEIGVADRGRGVAPGEVPLLFRPRTGMPRYADAPGVGLGLSLAWEQARGLGGDLTYSAMVPTGSMFRLSMPV